MSGRDWSIRTVEHEFTTGRSATLRKSLPMVELLEQGVLTEDMLRSLDAAARGEMVWSDAAALTKAVCVGMFVDPRIGNGGVPFEALEPEEVAETYELGLESIARVATFQRERSGARPGTGREGVGGKAKRAARPRARDSGGAPAGPATDDAPPDGAAAE